MCSQAWNGEHRDLKNGDPKHNVPIYAHVARIQPSLEIKFYIEIQISHQAVENKKWDLKY